MNRIFTKSKKKPIVFLNKQQFTTPTAQNNSISESVTTNLLQNKFTKKINEPKEKYNEKEKENEPKFQWFDKITADSGEVILNDTDAKSIKTMSTFQFSDDDLFSQPTKQNETEDKDILNVFSQDLFDNLNTFGNENDLNDDNNLNQNEKENEIQKENEKPITSVEETKHQNEMNKIKKEIAKENEDFIQKELNEINNLYNEMMEKKFKDKFKDQTNEPMK